MKKYLSVITLLLLSACCVHQKPICCDKLKADYHPVVHFEHNSADLSFTASDILNQLSERLKHCPDLKIDITGYTDNTGLPDYNKSLGTLRAQNVEMYLQSMGVNPKNIQTSSMGEADPVASNDTEAGRKQNRRVVIKLK